MNEKSSDAYGFDYETSSSIGSDSGNDTFSSKKKTSSFLNLPIFSYAFKGNGRRQPFGLKHGNDFAKSVKRKSPTFWITGLLAFCILAYPIYSLLNTSSGFKPVTGLSDSTILTTDPLIYPDLDNLGRSKSSGSGGTNRKASKKSPTDHTYDLSDKEMPAAAKGKRPGVAPGGIAGSNIGNDKNDDPYDENIKKNGPKSSNSEFHNRNAVLRSLQFHSPTKDGSFFRFGKTSDTPKQSPELVIVTGINPEDYSIAYLEKLIENRKAYAKKWGHGLYIRILTDFREEYKSTATKSPSWAKLPILRAAIHAFPEAKHFWNLDTHALIEDMDTNIVTDLIDSTALAAKTERDRPILRQNSIIKTYKHMSPTNARLILAPDNIGVSTASFVLANLDRDLSIDFASAGFNRYNVRKYKGGQRGIFAKSLLEYWFDPASRAYHQYDKSESSALNHILQWHAVFLSRTAIVNGRELMSFSEETVASLLGLRGNNLKLASQLPKEEGQMSIDDYEKDGLVFHVKEPSKRGRVVVLSSCATSSTITCLKEFSRYYNLQSNKDSTEKATNAQNIMIGNDQQKQQQQQAQQAQAHAQAQANAEAPGDVKYQQNAATDNTKLASNLNSDANKNPAAPGDIVAQVEADIAKKKAETDPKVQLQADIQKIKDAAEAQKVAQGAVVGAAGAAGAGIVGQAQGQPVAAEQAAPVAGGAELPKAQVVADKFEIVQDKQAAAQKAQDLLAADIQIDKKAAEQGGAQPEMVEIH